jgi:hypothetical protein
MFFCFLWHDENEAWDLGALDAGDGSVPNAAAQGALDTWSWDLQVCSVRSGGTGSTAGRQRLAGLRRQGLGGRRSGERGLLGLAASYLYVLLLGFVLHGLFTGPGLFGRGRGETGTGSAETSPHPPYPTGTSFSPFSSPRGLKCYHPRPLMEEFPAGNRGSGPVAIPTLDRKERSLCFSIFHEFCCSH